MIRRRPRESQPGEPPAIEPDGFRLGSPASADRPFPANLADLLESEPEAPAGIRLRDSTGREFRVVPLSLPASTDPARLRRVLAFRHPSLLPLHELGGRDEPPLFVQEVVEGSTLDQLIEGKPSVRAPVWSTWFQEGAVGLVRGMGSLALLAAELLGEGIDPRLEHPSRVFVGTGGRLYLRASDLLTNVEASESAPYLPLDRILRRGRPPLPSEDAVVYSLSSLLFHALAGNPPFPGREPAEVAHRILSGDSAPEGYWEPSVPSTVKELVRRAVHPDSQGRPTTLRGFAHVLESALSGERAWPRRRIQWDVVRQRRWIFVAVIMVLAAGWSLWHWQKRGARDHLRSRMARVVFTRPFPLAGEDPPHSADASQLLLDIDDELRRFRRDATVQVFRGWVFLRALRLSDSVQCFQRAVRYHGDSIPAWISLGIGRLELGDRGGASDMMRGFELKAKTADDWLFRGAGRLYRNDPAAAVRAFRKHLELDAGSAVGWVHLALASLYSGQRQITREALTQIPELNPRDLWAAWIEAQLLALEGRPEDSRRIIRELRSRFLGRPPLQLRVGHTLLLLGQHEQGQEWIRQATLRIQLAHLGARGPLPLQGSIEWTDEGRLRWPERESALPRRRSEP